MRANAKDSDAYLAEWRRSEPVSCSDELAAEADRAMAEIDNGYDTERLKRLIAQQGWENPPS